MASAATSPKNKRLAERDRDALLYFARKQIEATEDGAALDSAYELAAEAISAVVRRDNPPADMKVLAKYDLAHPDSCINVTTGGGDFDQFNFKDGDKRIPMRPYSRRGCGYGARPPVMLDDAGADVFKNYLAEEKARKEAIRTRTADFKALIWGTPSFNVLVESWPAAEAMREKVVGSAQAVAVLSSEVVNRLKSDPALVAAEPVEA